ncbi:MAG: hypothetical protein Kow0099_21220 [Candidatus Abyssubacteria bacterium]
MGEPDSYREALSALKYIHEGVYSSYWDHPLTMYVFVAATRLALALGLAQAKMLNTTAVLFGAAAVWPFYRLTERLTNGSTAAFATLGLILSPVFLKFSTYLSHEIVGFAFALWSLHLVESTFSRPARFKAAAAGFCLAATWSARPIVAMILAAPLIVLLLRQCRTRDKVAALTRLIPFALLGFVLCLALVYTPALIEHLRSYSGKFLFTYYEFGRYIRSTTLIGIESLTPALVALTALGCAALIAYRAWSLLVFGLVWIVPGYLFYTGMYSMHRYFLALLPPFILLCFAGADRIDDGFGRCWRFPYPAKTLVFLFLLVASLFPSVPEILYLARVNEDQAVSEAIGDIVGPNLLFTTAPEPMILYYNPERPPETVYLVTEYRPGQVVMRTDALQDARRRLAHGRPVFATGDIVRQIEFAGIDAEFEFVWEFRGRSVTLNLYRITGLNLEGWAPR